MRYGYSFSKSIAKGFYTALSGLVVIVAFTAFSDMTLWGLLETYVKPIFGSLTVVGALRALQNWVKYNYLS